MLDTKNLSDGNWHHAAVTWIGAEIKLSVDYDEQMVIIPYGEKIQGLYVGKILIGGPDNTYTSLNAGYDYFEGCIQDVRIGHHQTILNRPTVKENVLEGCAGETSCQQTCPAHSDCVTSWSTSHCECDDGYVGNTCLPVCAVNPCENSGTCLEDKTQHRGYKCHCNSTDFSGDYCENKIAQPCPASWWGYPVCGPCHCDVEAGYNPDCDKKTGACHCRENHYQKRNTSKCTPCDCYLMGSHGAQCHPETGQCNCKEGVIGQKCDHCPNPYAEVTIKGCEGLFFFGGVTGEMTLTVHRCKI